MEKENKVSKKETQNFIITSIAVVVSVVAFIGGFVLSGDLKDRIFRASDSSKDNKVTDDVYVAGQSSSKIYGFDDRYVESNNSNEIYNLDFGTYAGTSDSYFKISYGNTKNELVITKYFYDREDVQTYSIEFQNNVIDVQLGVFNDDPNYNTIFYLLDNGDVCYSVIEEMIKNDNYGYYNNLSEISKITKFYSGNYCDRETGVCKPTTFAQATNGIIYDLRNYINKAL